MAKLKQKRWTHASKTASGIRSTGYPMHGPSHLNQATQHRNPPTISVVIPAYNAVRFLPRCLASVFAQTRPPDEVIVVDDGSTDNTAAVAEQLGAKVVRRPNGGIAAARNTGIRSATGGWIALLDADDLWLPQKLERQAAAIRPDTVLVYTAVRHFDDHGIRFSGCAVHPSIARQLLRYSNPICPSTVLLERQATLAAGGFFEGASTCEDWALWVRLLPFGAFAAVDEPLIDYYVYPASLSASPERMLDGLKTILEPVLLAGFHGFERRLWRRRILATQHFSAAMIARENHLPGELGYIARSLRAWPSPVWQPRRFAAFIVTFKNKLLR